MPLDFRPIKPDPRRLLERLAQLRGNLSHRLRLSRRAARPLTFPRGVPRWLKSQRRGPRPQQFAWPGSADERYRFERHRWMLVVYLLSVWGVISVLRLMFPQGASSLIMLVLAVFYGSTLSVLFNFQTRRQQVTAFLHARLMRPLVSRVRDLLDRVPVPGLPKPPDLFPDSPSPGEVTATSQSLDLPRVAILVPAHNEAAVITQTAAQLLKQTYPHWELWILDDRSSDDTREALTAFCQNLPEDQRARLHCHHRPTDAQPGKSAVLNEALSMTDTPYVAVFDADAWVPPDWLERMVPLLSHPWVGAAQARKCISHADTNWLTRAQSMEYGLDSYIQLCRDSVHSAVELRGNGMLLKREALTSVNGWTEHTVTDDLDLSSKFHLVGWDIRFAPNVCVWEEGVPNVGPLLRQRRRWAEGSLRRYLDYGLPILERDGSRRTKLDVVGYIVNFTFPVWIGSDYLMWALTLKRTLHLEPLSHHLLTVSLMGFLTAAFTPVILVANLQFVRIPRSFTPFWRYVLGSLYWSAITSIYLCISWIVSVWWVLVSLIFRREVALKWDKTEHGQTKGLGTPPATAPSTHEDV
jgi:1,2-diacylglycerol 3-beta-glucosyltransferase